MKIKTLYCAVILAGILMTGVTNCKKKSLSIPVNVPELTTTALKEVTANGHKWWEYY